MNWTSLEKNYPKSYQRLADWTDENMLYRMYEDGWKNDIRNLYDFFDRQQIWINQEIDYASGSANDDVTFTWKILTPSDAYIDGFVNYYGSREESEIVAFTKAFKILEDKLS